MDAFEESSWDASWSISVASYYFSLRMLTWIVSERPYESKKGVLKIHAHFKSNV